MRRLLVTGLALAPALLPGCRRTPAEPGPGPKPNVLLVTIDTLRADRVGCYGHASASTPVLDALAARGVRFETAVVHVPLTGPSHASILTGLGPLGHGFRENAGFVLPAQVKSGAEDFRQAGYRTAAFVSAFPLDRRFGFDRGFDVYDDHLPKGTDSRRTPYVERFADATTDAVLRWLEAPAEGAPRPFFLWVHYYDPHAPYEPPGDLAVRFRTAPYDGEVAFADRQLGRLLHALDERGLIGQTLVLAMSDHGEGLGDHGEGTHGLFVYDSTLKVPFIVAGPGVGAGRVAPTVARGIDVLPTLLDYAGLPLRPDLEGRSLRPAIEGRAMDDAPTYVESLYSQREFGWAPLFAWRTARHKMIEAPRPELYDLQEDPGEMNDLAPRETARLADMRQTLEVARSQSPPSASAEVDPESAEMLRALGYIAKAGGQELVAGASLRDPKDGQRLVPRLNRGMSAVRTDPATAIRELRSVLAEDPGLLVARRSLAVAYTSARQYDRAIAELRRLEKDGVLTAEDGVVLGDNLRFAGRLDEATAVLERTARENPRFAQPWLSIAEVHVKRNELGEAAAAYQRVLEMAPGHVEALRGLGDLAFLREKPDEAARRYERILEIDPADAGAMTKLGVLRMRSGRPDEATALFRRAIERDPTNGEALLYLAGALTSTGRAAEAIPYFESLRIDPKQPDVARTLAEIGG